MRKKNEPRDSSLISQNVSTTTNRSGQCRSSVSSDENDRLLRVDEAAELLGLSSGGLYHLVSERRITVVRISSRCIRFRRCALWEWVESLTQKAERFPQD